MKKKKMKHESIYKALLDFFFFLAGVHSPGTRTQTNIDVAHSFSRALPLCPVSEDYTEELAVCHIRRLLDIVACTTSFGASSTSSPKAAGRPNPKEPPGPKDQPAGSDEGETTSRQPDVEALHAQEAAAGKDAGEKKTSTATNAAGQRGKANDGAEKGGDSAISMCPPPRLGQFYDFFSLSHLTAPLHCAFSLLFFSFSLFYGEHGFGFLKRKTVTWFVSGMHEIKICNASRACVCICIYI